jgi:hypothetical protein
MDVSPFAVRLREHSLSFHSSITLLQASNRVDDEQCSPFFSGRYFLPHSLVINPFPIEYKI